MGRRQVSRNTDVTLPDTVGFDSPLPETVENDGNFIPEPSEDEDVMPGFTAAEDAPVEEASVSQLVDANEEGAAPRGWDDPEVQEALREGRSLPDNTVLDSPYRAR